MLCVKPVTFWQSYRPFKSTIYLFLVVPSTSWHFLLKILLTTMRDLDWSSLHTFTGGLNHGYPRLHQVSKSQLGNWVTELRNWLDEEEGRRQEKNNNTEGSCWEGAARALVLSISGQKLGWFSTHIHAFSQLWPWHPWQCLSCRTCSTLCQLGWNAASGVWDGLAAVKGCCVSKTSSEADSDSQCGRVITAMLTLLLLLLLALCKNAHEEKAHPWCPKTGIPQFGQALFQLVSDMAVTLFLFQNLEKTVHLCDLRRGMEL